MAPRITSLDWDSYKNRDELPPKGRDTGDRPLETEEDRFQASFDINRGARDEEEYAGNESKGPMLERMSIVALVSNNPLTPPNVTSRMDDATAAMAAYQHYKAVLESGGPKALKLIRDLGSYGNTAVQKAREIGQGEDFTVVAGHRSVAHVAGVLIGTALDIYPPSRTDALQRNEEYTKRLQQERAKEAQSNRRLSTAGQLAKDVKIAKEMGIGTREGLQVLPTDASKIDTAPFLAALEARAKPKLVGRIHPETVADLLKPGNYVKDTDDTSPTFGTYVGLKPDFSRRIAPAYHDVLMGALTNPNAAARAASLRMPADAIDANVGFPVKTLAQSRAFFSDMSGEDATAQGIRKAKSNEEIVIGSLKETPAIKEAIKASKARVATVSKPDNKRAFVLEKQGMDPRAAKYIAEAEQILAHVDTVDMHLGKNPNQANLYILGMAIDQGKQIGHVTQDGRTLNTAEAVALGMSAYVRPRDAKRAQLAQGLDIPCEDAGAALAMSLMVDKQKKGMSTQDIKAIQKLGSMSLLDVAEAAKDPERAGRLAEEHGISLGALRLMADPDVLANAGRNVAHGFDVLQGTGQQLIGPDQYPAALRDHPKAPAFLIASGDVEAFTNAQHVVGIVGDRLGHKEAALGTTIAPYLAALDKADTPRAWVEGHTPLEFAPRKGDIVFLTGGIGASERQEDKDAQDARDLAGAVTLSTKLPSTVAYRPGKGKAKGEEVLVPNTPDMAQAAAAATLVSAASDRVLVTNARDMGAYSAAAAAITTQLEKGRRPVVIEPALDHADKTPVTAALARGQGRKALSDAGFGVSTVESMGVVEGGPVAMRLGRKDPAKAIEALAALVKGKAPAQAEQTKARAVENDAR